ncbi:MAG TPA: beta-ketoacyl-ACP synthase II [Bacillota bacterium]|nr:beta-ketoacyl-ACP synthase II [Bacillota bacterium]
MQNQNVKTKTGANRVVITGMGVISPVGNDTETFFDALVEGKIGVRKTEDSRFAGYKVTLAAEVLDFEPEKYMDKKEARRMDRYCQFALAAADEAVKMSGLPLADMDPFTVGAIIGSGVGGLTTMHNQYDVLFNKGGETRISPLFIPMMISNMAAGQVAMKYGIKGANFCVTTACASGTHAIGEAFRKIKHGDLEAAIAGGAEAPISEIAMGGFTNMKALNTVDDPNLGSLPFDARRQGFVIAEGAGILVLESMEHALSRNATIYGEIIGYGATADAYHVTSPDPEGKGAAGAMKLAMKEADVCPEEIDYINAHGTGTPINDKYETKAIKDALGEEAAYKVAVSSTKGVTGHLLGAAGGVEAVCIAQALRKGIIPPTVGLQEKDPECDLDYVPNIARKADIKIAMSNSLGFGGQNATLIMKKVED